MGRDGYEIILSIDPASTVSGWAVLALQREPERVTLIESGTFSAPVKHGRKDRLLFIYNAVAGLVKRFKPDRCYAEIPLLGGISNNPKSLIAQAAAFGVIILATGGAELWPSEVKKLATGRGNATKPYVLQSVALYLGMEPDEDMDPNESDAIAVGLAGLRKDGLIERCEG